MTDEQAAEPRRFWFNTTTHEVTEARDAPWTSIMGPYPTREAAEKALDTARSRTAAWDDEDEDDDA